MVLSSSPCVVTERSRLTGRTMALNQIGADVWFISPRTFKVSCDGRYPVANGKRADVLRTSSNRRKWPTADVDVKLRFPHF